MTANTQQEENLSRTGKIKKRLKEVWGLLEPYRLGFLLGILAVSATILIIATGKHSESLNFKAEKGLETASPAVEASVQGAATPSSPVPSSSSSSSLRGVRPVAISSDKINLNTATLSMLDTLPGIGPVTSQSIIDYRSAHGPFKSVNDLDNVKGIGPKTIEKIRNLVTVE